MHNSGDEGIWRGHGVIYVDKPEDVLKKVIELLVNETLKEYGLKARGFVEKYNWDDIVDDFEGGCSRREK